MNIVINGEPRLINHSTLHSLLLSLQLVDKRIAVEFNGEIRPRSQWAETHLNPGDCIEIVHAIGGG